MTGVGHQKASHPKYVIISPVRDEAAHIEETIRSVLSQSMQPLEWIIVDDGSQDSTGQILEEKTKGIPWIRVLHRENRGYRKAGGGVVEAFYDGYRTLQCAEWDFIVKLDGDLSFPDNYFAQCFEEFRLNPSVGIGGGAIYTLKGSARVLERGPSDHVRGATKIYRRECWEAIGDLLAAPGWDTLDEVKASLSGWQTRTFSGIAITQHRRTGGADGSWREWYKNGQADYICGNRVFFMILKCGRRAFHPPFLFCSLALAAGFLSGYVRKGPQIKDPELISALRQRKWQRLWPFRPNTI